MLEHGEAKVLITDREFSGRDRPRRSHGAPARPLVIDVDDPVYAAPASGSARWTTRRCSPAAIPATAGLRRVDEWDAISLNYTSGTTGNPKGVVVPPPRRLPQRDRQRPRLEHAAASRSISGRCRCSTATAGAFPGRIAALAGTNVCLRRVEAAAIFRLIREHRVTHYCGAPIVHNTAARTRRTSCGPGSTHGSQGDDRRRRAAGRDDRGDGALRLRAHPRLRPHRGLRPGHACAPSRRNGPRSTPTSARAGTGARACATSSRKTSTVLDPDTHGAGAAGRRDDRRDHVPRQHHDEGLPQEPDRHRGGVRGRLVPLGRPRR